MRAIMVSLQVRNLEVSKAFFARLGFAFSPELTGPGAACLLIGENVRVLLLAEDHFRDYINGDAGDAGSAGQILISLPARSEQEVDEIVTRAIVAGATPWPLLEERRVYSGSFRDPDGHLWQVTCPRRTACQETSVAGEPIAA